MFDVMHPGFKVCSESDAFQVSSVSAQRVDLEMRLSKQPTSQQRRSDLEAQGCHFSICPRLWLLSDRRIAVEPSFMVPYGCSTSRTLSTHAETATL